MKKTILFFSFVVVIFLLQGRIKQDAMSHYLNHIFGQSSICSLFEKKDYENDASIVSNKAKILYSYNPPKAYLGICIVSIITLFVISEKYKISHNSECFFD